MDSLKMQSPNLVDANIEKIADLFPNCITEASDESGAVKRRVDFDLLRQELSASLVEGPQERYALNWPGKNEAVLTANAPIAKTLRPCKEESVDFENTKNIFIEGDNLDALKLLQETYLNKIKMIYIDPPYNTGNDFIYDDDFAEDAETFLQRSNQKDEHGNRLIANTEANGRFHSDWLSMMFSRLKLARNLLSDDGFIFISIDDIELANLEKICCEIFGESNHIGTISRSTGTRMGSGSRGIARELDYILVFSKSIECSLNTLPMTQEEMTIYNEEDERGKYLTRSLRRTGGENRREDRPTMFYPVDSPDGDKIYPIAPEGWESRWVCGKETYEKLKKEGYIEWKKLNKDGKMVWQVYQKHYMNSGRESSDLWTNIDGNKKATKELNSIFNQVKVFDHPKPIALMQKIIQLGASSSKNDIILDFFGGSCSTALAILYQNIQDSGNRKFIMVQLPEICDEKSEAFKAGYKTISEIGKERIRRAGKKIKEENPITAQNLDIGFRVLKVDTSNMKDVYYTPDKLEQENLHLFKDHIKPDRSSDDLLYQVFIDWGLDLTLPIAKETIDGKTVFLVDTNALIACFDSGITEELVKKLAAHKPLRVVFRDDAFGSDSVKINVEQIFKLLSPRTEVKPI